MLWPAWKKGFDAWEIATARLLEQTLRSPLVLGPAGSMLSAVLRVKRMSDDRLAGMWTRTGMANRREQEHAMHLLNQLESRLLDLEEEIGISDGGGRSRTLKRKQGKR